MTTRNLTLPARSASRGAAFTLIELLVVVAIIGLLVAIGGAAFSRGRALARKAAMQTLFAGIEMGLRTYKTDLGEYPPSFGPSPVWRWPNPANPAAPVDDWAGAHWLAHAILGLGDENVDGKDGPGFRTLKRGNTYGPYVDADRAKTKMIGPAQVLTDGGGAPILYYRFDPGAGQYNTTHNNSPLVPGIKGPVDRKLTPADVDINDYAAFGSRDLTRLEYIICSPGEDGLWGDDADKNDELDGLGDDYTNLSE